MIRMWNWKWMFRKKLQKYINRCENVEFEFELSYFMIWSLVVLFQNCVASIFNLCLNTVARNHHNSMTFVVLPCSIVINIKKDGYMWLENDPRLPFEVDLLTLFLINFCSCGLKICKTLGFVKTYFPWWF